MVNFEALASSLLANAETHVSAWLSYGKKRGHEWVAGDLTGAPGDSLSVNLLTGQWADFSTDHLKGGDLISLYAAINSLTQLEAAKQLGGEDRSNGHANGNGHALVEAEADPVILARPPQVDFQPSMFRHSRHGTPVAFWVYRDFQGPLFVVARYDARDGGRKQFCPWIFDGVRWRQKAPPKPRPLYGLDRLSLNAPVLLVEGEKAADSAQRYWPGRPCLAWFGGVGGALHADFEPLAKHNVDLWPDADEPGRTCMARIAEKLLALGCTVRLIDTSSMPDGWDLADGEASGMTKDELTKFARTHIWPIEPPKPAEITPKVAPNKPTVDKTALKSSVAIWQAAGLATKPNGAPYANMLNVERALQWKKAEVFYDEFSQRVMTGAREWDDDDTSALTHWVQNTIKINEIRQSTVYEGLFRYASDRRRNPPKEWLQSLKWDEVGRLDDLMYTGFGAVPGEYSSAVGRCFMVGMVARVMQPGCKADCMPVFEGPQGAFKSSALRVIGGDYFAEVAESIVTKDFYLAITGKILCELSELSSLSVAHVEKMKAILSTSTDRYRVPFGRLASDHPRTCVFAGTTNSTQWNTDETGARRFWPVACTQIDLDWLRENREQLFAEAVARYLAGESWWDVPVDEANRQRAARFDEDPWQSHIGKYVEGREWVTIDEIFNNPLNIIEIKEVDKRMKNRVGACLVALGFVRTNRREGHRVYSAWARRR